MPAVFYPLTQRACTTTLQDIGPQGQAVATPAGKVRTASVRVAYVGAGPADRYFDLYVVDTSVSANANDGYRVRNYPIEYLSKSGAPDMEWRVPLTAGQKLQHRGSTAGDLAISVAWVEDDA
ncbi:hypothetical protein [Caulobacter sp. BP25]|uniref:hypothetical protein n=1 Tax=Caulobacter sp. BP25 TaxID=2048900 RepID=UPI000C12AB30|nr:hypothetical protein [Caulobacter sp. BP25]PHY20822.1 hypothetical protein CSW59_06250 [Caulobacter sp. BP25]